MGPLAAARADAPQVTVVTAGGAQRTLALEALAGNEDVVGRTYALRSEDGESSEEVSGFSIAGLLAAADVDPYAFSYLEVRRPGGGAVWLSRNQALEPSAFPDGPPVVYPTPSGTGFLRPSAGPGDDNAGDSFTAPQGLTIALRKGAALRARVEASPRRVAAGQKVRFRAVVERAGAGEVLSYSWYFDDGNSGEGQTATHAFAGPGSYAVVVGVTAAGEDTGTSAVVRVQVGKPAAGPDRQGGGHDQAAGAPDHGAADGPSGPAVPNARSSPAAGTGPAGATAAPTPATDPASATVPSRPTPREAAPKPRAAPGPERPSRATGELVSGELLAAGAAPPPAAATAKRAAARAGTPRAAGGGGVPDAAWGLGAVAVLLGAGALLEAGALTDLLPRLAERLR